MGRSNCSLSKKLLLNLSMNKLKLLGVIGTLILIANVFLFAFRIITSLIFWIIIMIMAGLVYLVLPRIRKS